MARTKQTSKKTTGGPAKRRDLQKLKVPGRFSAEVSRPVFPPSPAETNLKAMFTPDSQCKAENSTFLKPSTHNIVSTYDYRPVLYYSNHTLSSSAVFAGTVALCTIATDAHAQYAKHVLSLHNNLGSGFKNPTFFSFARGAMRNGEIIAPRVIA
jgi:hypothetical protein